MDIQSLLEKNYIADLVEQTCGTAIELVNRNDCFVVRSKEEHERDIHRLIMLPPRGFTANEINQMNSHDEADFATIEIKGTVREGKRALSKLKNCLLVASKDEEGKVSDLNHPYLTFDINKNADPDLTLSRHSAGTAPFYVVKNNGYGFYHNLINLTDDWLVLKLHKRLRPQKSVNLEPIFENLSADEAQSVKSFYAAIVKYGDSIFQKSPDVVNDILSLSIDRMLPALAEMLYVHDSGMHEACTVFGVILKIGNRHPDVVIQFLEKAMNQKTIPTYYAEQLIGKINNKKSKDSHTQASRFA